MLRQSSLVFLRPMRLDRTVQTQDEEIRHLKRKIDDLLKDLTYFKAVAENNRHLADRAWYAEENAKYWKKQARHKTWWQNYAGEMEGIARSLGFVDEGHEGMGHKKGHGKGKGSKGKGKWQRHGHYDKKGDDDEIGHSW